MKIINIEDNEILIDDEDYLYITNFYNLRMSGNYVSCTPKRKYRKMGLFSHLQLQKLLLNPEKTGRKVNVDHIDGNENNYQKDNLRVCTHAENMRNRKPNKQYANRKTSSKYKGVHWDINHKVWMVAIQTDDVCKFLGRFTNEDAAGNCYNYWAEKIHGEYARLNQVDQCMDRGEWEQHLKFKNVTSQYRGVSLIDGRWVAQICHKSKNIRIGSYNTEEEAARAYNAKGLELKGNRAFQNIIGEGVEE